jgi:hypothetical protein
VELSPREKVLLLGRDLPIGTTENRTLCFFCGGGESKDRSFAVTRVDKLCVKYMCHREKCGKRGSVFLNGGGGEEETKLKVFQPNPIKAPLEGLEFTDLQHLDSKYDLDLDYVVKAGWCRVSENGFNLCMPCISPTGALRGHVVRRVNQYGKKSLQTFKVLDEPWLCWYRTAIRDIVVVEDQISALKAARFVTSVALLGCDLSQNKVDEIKQVAGKEGRVFLCLDPDAKKKTLEYLQRYRIQFGGNLYGIVLSKDLKDVPYAEIAGYGPPFSYELP